jgi:succinyl-diaminopimelate desuccinylase
MGALRVEEMREMKGIEGIWREIDEKGAVEFLQQFLQTRSANPPGEEIEAAELVAGWMRRWGLEAEVIPIVGKRANALGRLPGKGKKPPLLFSGHLDTVRERPLGDDPFSGRIVGSESMDEGLR